MGGQLTTPTYDRPMINEKESSPSTGSHHQQISQIETERENGNLNSSSGKSNKSLKENLDYTKSRKVREKTTVGRDAYYKLPGSKNPTTVSTRYKSKPKQILTSSHSSSNSNSNSISTSDSNSCSKSLSLSFSENDICDDYSGRRIKPQSKTPTKSSELRKVKRPTSIQTSVLPNSWYGLPNNDAKRAAEKAIQKAFASPHSSFVHATPVTNIVREKIIKDDFIFDDLEYSMSDYQKVVDVPLNSVNLRMIKNRISRSKVDPWRRHGAHTKLCEIGGNIPDLKKKDKKTGFTRIRPGSVPPAQPRTKPLTTIKDYMTFKQ